MQPSPHDQNDLKPHSLQSLPAAHDYSSSDYLSNHFKTPHHQPQQNNHPIQSQSDAHPYSSLDYLANDLNNLSVTECNNPSQLDSFQPPPSQNYISPYITDTPFTSQTFPNHQVSDLQNTNPFHPNLASTPYTHSPTFDTKPISPPAKSTLNAQAPEFFPSFVVLPIDHILPPEKPIYLPQPVSSSPDTTVEHAVQNFERQFPPLPGAKSALEETKKPVLHKALGWHELQHEQREKVRIRKNFDEQTNFLRELELVIAAAEEEDPEANITADVGRLWVSTGQSVAELYEELRAEAAEQASVRNKYFDRAAAAFKRNDGATAKKMGALGRDANERMKELHRQAADSIFATRNPPHVQDVIDFHGLHVSEAIERLPAALEGKHGKVRILTGTGHHTKGTGRARLRPAVKKWLQENGFFFEEVIDANEYVGSFVVDIPNP